MIVSTPLHAWEINLKKNIFLKDFPCFLLFLAAIIYFHCLQFPHFFVLKYNTFYNYKPSIDLDSFSSPEDIHSSPLASTCHHRRRRQQACPRESLVWPPQYPWLVHRRTCPTTTWWEPSGPPQAGQPCWCQFFHSTVKQCIVLLRG